MEGIKEGYGFKPEYMNMSKPLERDFPFATHTRRETYIMWTGESFVKVVFVHERGPYQHEYKAVQVIQEPVDEELLAYITEVLQRNPRRTLDDVKEKMLLTEYRILSDSLFALEKQMEVLRRKLKDKREEISQHVVHVCNQKETGYEA